MEITHVTRMRRICILAPSTIFSEVVNSGNPNESFIEQVVDLKHMQIHIGKRIHRGCILVH